MYLSWTFAPRYWYYYDVEWIAVPRDLHATLTQNMTGVFYDSDFLGAIMIGTLISITFLSTPIIIIHTIKYILSATEQLTSTVSYSWELTIFYLLRSIFILPWFLVQSEYFLHHHIHCDSHQSYTPGMYFPHTQCSGLYEAFVFPSPTWPRHTCCSPCNPSFSCYRRHTHSIDKYNRVQNNCHTR